MLLPSGLKSADEASGFEYGEKRFDVVLKLATACRQLRLQGGPDAVATQVFGTNVWAAKESQTMAQNGVGKAERTFDDKGQPLQQQQHLKIGVKNSPNRTLCLHFEWDSAISTGGFDACVDIANAGDHSSLSHLRARWAGR